jgi:hypothetical protein
VSSSDPFSIYAPPGALGSFVRRTDASREPVEFATVEPGPVVLVRLPDTANFPPAVREALDDLARACHEAYGYGVEVIADDRDDVYAALDLIRRHVDR